MEISWKQIMNMSQVVFISSLKQSHNVINSNKSITIGSRD